MDGKALTLLGDSHETIAEDQPELLLRMLADHEAFP
jgi:hypothetical protein